MQLFSCDCCDRYDDWGYDDDYPGYDDGGDYDPMDMYDEYYDNVWGEYRNSEDEDENENEEEEEEEDYNEDRSPSPDEHKEIIKQEDDKTVVRVTNDPHFSAVMETKVDVRQETKEEIFDGPIIGHLADPKLEKKETPTGTISDAAFVKFAAGSGTGERASSSSGTGPDVQTEGKRVSGFRWPWNPRAYILHDPPRYCEVTDLNRTES